MKNKKEKAFEEYLKANGKISAAKLAKEIGVSPGTIYLWKKRYSWDKFLNKRCDNASAEEKSLFDEMLPYETRDIISMIEASSGPQILRQNILLQYAAIIRAQKMMDVTAAKELSDTQLSEKTKHEVWEKYKVFLDTQSKAMSTLTSMLTKFDDYRRNGLEDDELTAKIALIKSKAKALTDKNSGMINVISGVPRGNGSPESEEIDEE